MIVYFAGAVYVESIIEDQFQMDKLDNWGVLVTYKSIIHPTKMHTGNCYARIATRNIKLRAEKRKNGTGQ